MSAMRMKLRAALSLTTAVLAVAATLAATTSDVQAAPAPATLAAGQLQHLSDSVRSDGDDYAGLWVDQADDTVFVATTNRSLTPSSVASTVPKPAPASRAMKIDVVHVQYNADQLDAIASHVTSDSRLRAVAKQSGAAMAV
ncbi:hypothetical protein [Streptacidiphilus sp. P02-A3a]|uniref:hypothetical protein n=1 Tax=Streptacidiphilus sp. P02-A3a TaxID=2704468 RepID=UPI0015FDF51D|nr:hypothetical protein [Streptacidiphilus sp. P02-A3a]QMU67074.1 hypothetical protein GXP74_01450 [Streptacidiphilus sp. P02-A3a]